MKAKRRKTSVLIDVVLSADINVTQKKAEKKLVKSLCIEIKRMWNMKCMIIPVVIGYIGIVSKWLKKNWEAVTGKLPMDSVQKTTVLGTSHKTEMTAARDLKPER